MAQGIQSVAFAELYLPATQSAHDADVDVALNFPARQSLQEEAPSEENVPALQFVQEPVADTLYLPATQDTHDVLSPNPVLNVPGAQVEQDATFPLLYWPALQAKH